MFSSPRMLPLDDAYKNEGPQHRCAAALLPTVPPAFVFFRVWCPGRYVVMRDAPNQVTFRVCSLRLCAVPLCTMRGSFVIR